MASATGDRRQSSRPFARSERDFAWKAAIGSARGHTRPAPPPWKRYPTRSSRVIWRRVPDPYRLDLPPAWIPAARERGIPFVISTDAHSISDFDNLEYGVAIARRGGVRRDEVLNTLPLAAFRAAVRP